MTSSRLSVSAEESKRKRQKVSVPSTEGGKLRDDPVLETRLKYYNLDYDPDVKVHMKNIYDPKSKYFSRSIAPKFPIIDTLPYSIESHMDQARYLCHVVYNLYLSITSLDIQGLISINSKDLAALRDEVDSLVLQTDLFRISPSSSESDSHSNDIGDFDETEDLEEQLDDEYVDIGGPDFNATGKITSKSGNIINVNYWTNELKNCMHFDFPLTLRKSLAKVYYYLSLVQGQKIYRQLHVSMFETLVNNDDEGTNFTELMIEKGLILDHQIMFDFLSEFLPYPDSDFVRYELTSKDDLFLFRLLLRLAHAAKPFYDREKLDLLSKIMAQLLSSLAPSTMSTILPIVTSFVPYQYNKGSNIIEYFSFFFSMWSSVSANVAIDTHMYDLVGNVAENVHTVLMKNDKDLTNEISFNEFGILTSDQAAFMFNRLQGHLRSDGQIHSYSRTVRPFVYMLNGNAPENYLSHLKKLAKSIETFIHPSNSGFWTKPISKFIHGFIKMYHGRVYKEKKLIEKSQISEFMLTAACHEQMVDIFLKLIKIGSQNKNSDITNSYISSLAYLLDVKPPNSNKIFESVLVDLYDSFGGEFVNSRHRIIASLKQFTRVVRFMTLDKIYRTHITNILLTLVAKIDMNDVQLTSNIVNGIVSIISYIPLKSYESQDEFLAFESHTLPFIEQHYYHLRTSTNGETFIYDEEFLDKAFKASTTIFESVLKIYVDKIYQLVDVDLEDGLVTKLNQTTMVMQESMDDKIFSYYADLMIRTFWDNDSFKEKNPNYEIITIPLAAIVKRESTRSKSFILALMNNVRLQVERGAGSIRSVTEIQHRDVKLVLYLSTLNDVLRQARSTILEYSDELLEFFYFIFEEITNPPLDVITSILLHNTLYSLTTTELVDTRLFPQDSKFQVEEMWGGLQFDERKYETENLNFKWHIPSKAEIDLAISFVKEMVKYCVAAVDKLQETPLTDTLYSDKIQKYVLVITHALSGSSLLFDPDFNRHSLNNFGWNYFDEKLTLFQNQQEDSKEQTKEISAEPQDSRSVKFETENIEKIEYKDEESDLILEDHTNSERPSGPSTPGLSFDGKSQIPSSDSGFREIDIYRSNYYFGNTQEERFNHPQYLHIHSVRSEIGKFFHKLYLFLTKNFENNTNMFQILLHGMKVWFADVGREVIFNEEPSAYLDLDFLENIQSLAHLDEPFTRTCLAVKSEYFHQSRVLLHSTTRIPSQLENLLLRDIINLSISIYPDIFTSAQTTLVYCMKQLIGSYGTVINVVLDALGKALEENDKMKIDVILKLLLVKKIYRKLMTDYKNLERILFLLIECCKINEFEIAVYAEQFLLSIGKGVKIPSSVCIIDKNAYEPITPPEALVELQTQAIRLAKDKKRTSYIDLLVSLQDKFIAYLKKHDDIGWKIPMFVVQYITKLQSSLEIQPDGKFISIILEQTETKHPQMIHLVIKSILGVANKVLSMSDYKHDISKAYQSTFDPEYIKTISTNELGDGSEFFRECNNFKNPNYFIDSRSYVGWLCWGRPMKIVRPGMINIALDTSEVEMLKNIGELITKEWVNDVCTHLVHDNENRGVFSSGNVSFFSFVLLLIEKRYCFMDIQDIFDLCERIYNTNDKPAMIMAVEIVASLVTGTKYMSDKMISKRDIFIEKFLSQKLGSELNHDAFEIWSTLTWWLPTVVDIRRCPPVYEIFSKFTESLNSKSDAATEQVFKIQMYRSILVGLEYRTPNTDAEFSKLVFDHPYEHVRESIAKLFATLVQNKSSPSYDSPESLIETNNDKSLGLGVPLKLISEDLDKFIRRQFNELNVEFEKLDDSLSVQQLLKTKYYYIASTLYYWIREMARGPNRVLLIPYIVELVLPFLVSMIRQKELSKLSGLELRKLYIGLAYMPFRKENLEGIVDLVCQKKQQESSYLLQIQLSFVQHFFSNQLLQLTRDERDKILHFVTSNLYDADFVEVRIKASAVMSDIVHNLRQEDLDTLIKKFEDGLGAYSWEKKKELSKNDPITHGHILGLGSVISAFPYVFPLPQWIPKQLSTISSWARTSGISGMAAKNTINEFKKVRADTWHFDRLSFTSEELEDLEGVLWRSYYA
ncbi:hypothetical protein RNJ44_03683 [Nakaseomyces bracarensis]|uniref:Proteasome activator BLM10 n=1 Tax=Nakaseomyces bracarensis TaxID=273131 RepID=A0ABR4NXM0_9SACH